MKMAALLARVIQVCYQPSAVTPITRVNSSVIRRARAYTVCHYKQLYIIKLFHFDIKICITPSRERDVAPW